MILQQQIDHIQGIKENIIIPSVQMNLLRQPQPKPQPDSISVSSNNQSTENNTEVSSKQTESKCEDIDKKKSRKENSKILNPCVICYEDEKQLACIPCGHLTTCVPCSHSLRICPICRKDIEAFVRIYL